MHNRMTNRVPLLEKTPHYGDVEWHYMEPGETQIVRASYSIGSCIRRKHPHTKWKHSKIGLPEGQIALTRVE